MKILPIIVILVLLLAGCGEKNENTTNNSMAQRTATSQNINNNQTQQIIPNNIENENNIVNIKEHPQDTEQTEEELTSFTTKILTDDEDREHNIELTCSKINDYILKPGDTFSFTKTVGKATYDKGYEKADIFDANGNKKKGLGGGNCQVSSTLYNAVMDVDGLEVVERHEHSSKVYYVPVGKDATVAYGSLDFRFKNNNDYSIKIKASSTSDEVNVKLFKV